MQMQPNLPKVISPIHVIKTQTNYIEALMSTTKYEHVNKVPKVGWASSILPNKLGGANLGPMGTPNCGWVPIRTDFSCPQGPCVPPNKVLTREHGQYNHQGQGTSGQRSDCEDTTNTTEPCVSSFPRREKGEGQRPVIYIKGLNQCVKTEHFKMEDVHLLPDLAGA